MKQSRIKLTRAISPLSHLLFIGSLLLFPLISPAAQELSIYTEEFPPYSYTEEGGRITGVSTEVVRALTERAGYQVRIQSLTWALSLEKAQRQPMAMVYSTSRRPSRENLFQWVGMLIPTRHSVFARHSSGIRISSLEKMKSYRIGTGRGDARELFFLNRGFVQGRSIRSLSGPQANRRNLQRLLKRKIDLWPMPDAVAYYLVESLGRNPGTTLERVYTLKELSQEGYWLAVSPSTPSRVVKDLQQALDSLKDDGTYQEILSRWGLSP